MNKKPTHSPSGWSVDFSPGAWHAHALSNTLGHHAAEWDGLNKLNFKNHPLLDSRFWNALLSHHSTFNVVLWRFDHQGQALAMCLLIHVGFGHWRSFLPSQAQLGPTLIGDKSQVRSLLRDLRPRVKQLDLLCVDPDFSPLLPDPAQRADVKHHALTMNVDCNCEFDQYWLTRSLNLRKNQRRYVKRASEAAITLDLKVSTDPADVHEAVNRYAVVESAGWKGRTGTALTEANGQLALYSEILTAYARSRQAKVVELVDNNVVIASRLIIFEGSRAVILKTCYDERTAFIGPSWLLLEGALKRLFRHADVDSVEFYTNASPAQLAWSSSSRWILHLTYYPESGVRSLWQYAIRLRSLFRTSQAQAPNDALTIEQIALTDTWPADVVQLMQETSNIEASSDWFKNLWQTVFADHAQGELWVLRNGKQVLAALPMVQVAHRRGLRLTPLSNYYTSLYSPALAKNLSAQDLAHLFRHLKRYFPHLYELRFEPLDVDSPTFYLLQEAMQLAGFIAHRYFRFGNWYLRSPGSYAQYLKERSANFRSNTKRVVQYMHEKGGSSEIVTEENDLERALEAYWTVYRASWKQEESHPDFIAQLVRWCAKLGYLRLGITWLDSKPIAAQIWIVANGKASIFKVAYDENYKALSPGNALTAFLLSHALDKDKVTEIDFLIGDDDYKRYWMSHRRERWGVTAFNPRTLAGTIELLKLFGARLLRQILPKKSSGVPK